MQILYERLGFATNSSSAHAPILMKDPDSVTENWDGGTEFGWGDFVLKSDTAKLHYLAAHVFMTFQDTLHYSHQDAVTRTQEVLNAYDLDLNDKWTHVDHQSALVIPLDRYGHSVDRPYINRLREIFMQPNLVVFGGNDNTDMNFQTVAEQDPDFGIHLSDLPTDMGLRGYRALHQSGDLWTLFRPQDGHLIRVRLSADNSHDDSDLDRARVPELVDVKITDFCDQGCAFCYQGSGPKGQHASTYYVNELGRLLGEAGTFEVAIGGGEPTGHPNLVSILSNFRMRGVVPNLTTGTTKWIGTALEHHIMSLCGGVAFSLSNRTANSAQVFSKILALRGKYRDRQFDSGVHARGAAALSIQVVERVLRKSDFIEVLKWCDTNNVTLTLLGYKDAGRGQDFRKHLHDYDWFDVVRAYQTSMKELHGWSTLVLGVDSVIAQRDGDRLRDVGVSSRRLTASEGKWTMYVDCVEKVAGESSFVPRDQLHSTTLGNDYDSLKAMKEDGPFFWRYDSF